MPNDDFEDYDKVVDSFDGETVPVELGDSEAFITEAIGAISSAPNAPLSSAPKINREEVLGFLQDAITGTNAVMGLHPHQTVDDGVVVDQHAFGCAG